MKSDVLELAQKLIQIPSVSGDKKQNDKVLSAALRELKGFNTRTFQKDGVKSVLVYKGKKATGTYRVLLNAHLDVVPGKPEQFTPKIKGNKLFGRGAYDMKSAAAALIIVYKELAKDLSFDIALQLVTDEEIGGERGAKLQLEKGVQADLILAGENTDLLINNEAKGILRIKLSSQGAAAHAAYPWLSQNAIIGVIKGVEAVLTAYPVPRKEVWKTTANLATISTTNDALNKVPEYAEAIFDIRYVPKEKDTIIAKLKNLLPKGVKMEVLRIDPPAFSSENDPFIKHLQHSIKVVTGREGKLVSKHGASDIRFYTERGSTGITFGPTGAGHHSDEEWVDIKSLEKYYEILKDFLLTL